MKSALVLGLSLISFSTLASVELYFKFENLECHIANGKVHKTMSFMKGEMTSTVTYDIKTSDLSVVAKKAAELSSGQPYSDTLVQTVTIDGEKHYLNTKDSSEARALISLMGNACK